MSNKNRWFSLMLSAVLGTVGILSQPVLAESGKKGHKPDNRTLLTIPYQDREDLMGVMRRNLASLGGLIDAMAEFEGRPVGLAALRAL